MTYTKTLTVDQDAIMVAKAALTKDTTEGLFDVIIDRYIADCKRDVGQDVDTAITKRIAALTDTEKTALLATLPIKEAV